MSAIVFDFLLIILFFIFFKLYDIYVATAVIIAGALVQLLFYRFTRGYFEKKQIFIFLTLVLFGGLTLYFRNPIFIKWKPTVVFWMLGMVFLATQFFGKKSLIQRLVGDALQKNSIPATLWKKLNLAWALFFISLGGVNLIVAYTFSTEIWVYFKLYGILGALLLFGLLQSFYLARFITIEK